MIWGQKLSRAYMTCEHEASVLMKASVGIDAVNYGLWRGHEKRLAGPYSSY